MADDLSLRVAVPGPRVGTVGIRPLVLPLGIAAALIAAAASAAIFACYRHDRERESQRLMALSELRVTQVSNWLEDRVSQARFAGNSPLGELYLSWRDGGNAAAGERLLNRLASFHKATGGHSVLIVDDQGEVAAAEPPQSPQAPAELRATARQAIMKNAPQFTTFYGHQGPSPAPRIDVVAPLVLSGTPARAAVVLRLDPRTYLFPLLSRWPVPSETAAATIVRRDGDHLVGPFAKVRLPMSKPDLLAAKVLRGESPPGVVIEAVDFKDREVLGVVRPIPGTDWFLVAKIDRHEVYADTRLAAVVIVMTGALAWLAIAAFAYGWRERSALRQSRLEREEQEAIRVRLEELVAQRTRELATKNAVLERTVGDLEAFSASISHDLRGPLRTVNGFAAMLERSEGDKLSGEGRRKLGRILAGARTMDRMIEDILECSRADRGEMEFGPVDLNRIVDDVVNELARDYPATQVVLGPLPIVRADETMTRQVFANLVGNALKFSAHQPAPRVEIGMQPGDNGPRLFVRDNGVGFDEQQAHKLFAPFQRLHSEEEFAGTGVGLSIVKRLVERHGGTINAQSQPDGPTIFIFDFGPPGFNSIPSSPS